MSGSVSVSVYGQSGVIFYYFLLMLLFITTLNQGTTFVHGEEKKGASSSTTEMVPLIIDEHFSPRMMNMVVVNMMMNETETNNISRRKLNSFRICALCTCCGGPKGDVTDTVGDVIKKRGVINLIERNQDHINIGHMRHFYK
ncbi:hypothetical protein MKX01_028620 [Papaver californicum]|nr:hypothetical protein MKX01_028620 [Papaver californicum]